MALMVDRGGTEINSGLVSQKPDFSIKQLLWGLWWTLTCNQFRAREDFHGTNGEKASCSPLGLQAVRRI